MKNNQQKILNVLLWVNIFCALTEAAYYLLRVESVIFNVSAVIWVVAMIANMAVCLEVRKKALFRTIAMMMPTLLIFMTGMMATNTTGSGMGIAIEIMAFLYFAFSAFHSWYLSSDKYSEKPNKPAGIVSLVLYGLMCVVSFTMFGWYYYCTIIVSELTMSSSISWASSMRLGLIMWVIAAAFGLARRLKTRGIEKAGKVIVNSVLILAGVAMIPSLAATNGAQNAEYQYTKIFGGEEQVYTYSIPQAVFGSTESGISALKDQVYMVMNYEGKDYELAFDMYTPEDATEPLPVLLKIHGSGGSKGLRNNALMAQGLASGGYAVIDMNYGNEKVKPSNDELTENLCQLLNYLYEHQEELNLDMDNVFVSGASRGGKMTMKVCSAWARNSYLDIKNKVTIRGAIVYWGMMNDVFERTGEERIVSLEELTSEFPATLFIDTTHDGSVQGGNLLEGVLYTLGVPSANIELRYAMHGASNHYYGFYGQLCDYYALRFMGDMVN